MGDTIISCPKNKNIPQLFKEMNLDPTLENTRQASEWLSKNKDGFFAYVDKPNESPKGDKTSLKNAALVVGKTDGEILCNIYTPDAATVDSILSKYETKNNKWMELGAVKRSEIMLKLAQATRNSHNILSQIEVMTRGILATDTKIKAIPLLTDYIQYYSSFCVTYSVENPTFKPQGICVALIPDTNSLVMLGCILGPALAAGYQVILQTGTKITPSAAFLLDLAVNTGIPEGTLRILPGDDIDPSIFFSNPKVVVVAIFDNLNKERYFVNNHSDKKLLNLSSSGIPMIVFEGSDLDSACQCLIDAAWGYQGLLPWSVKQVLVQENILPYFVEKLKKAMNSINIGGGDQKNIDISYPIAAKDLDKGQTVIAQLTTDPNSDAEIYQLTGTNETAGKTFPPTLIIGGNFFGNNVLKEDVLSDIPVVTLTAFRNVNEATSLANNSRQGLAASVWTENISLANEVITKLKVSTVWINSHGQFTADTTTSPCKGSGNAYFGGPEGFYEYVNLRTLDSKHSLKELNNAQDMESAIGVAKKAQESWSKLTRLQRSEKLQYLAQSIQSISNLPEKWIENWIHSIHYYNTCHQHAKVSRLNNFNILTGRKPHGVVVIETLSDLESHKKKLIIAALIEGNTVIILNHDQKNNDFYNLMGKNLLKDVLNVVDLSQEAVKVAALHKDVTVYFGEGVNSVFGSFPLWSSSKFKSVQDNWSESRDKVTLSQTAWLTSTKSFF